MKQEALLTDLYQLTMAAGHFAHGRHERKVSFELFVRKLPPHRRYLVSTGLARVVDYLRELRFDRSQLEYMARVPALRSALSFEFQEYLSDFRFRGELWAAPEGTVIFENEPIIRVTGTLLEAQLVETFVLSVINSETATASKAARVVRAADGRVVMEFGSRRTSPEEAVACARAAYVAGFDATSNVEAGYRYDIPIAGTVAHSWIMSFEDEVEAFEKQLAAYPEHGTFLVDTFDTARGIDRAIEVAKDKLRGIRLDSGDMAALSKMAREKLDAAGLKETKIIATGDLDETAIAELLANKSPIDAFGVGTKLVRPADAPTIGAVYKLVHDHTADRAVAKHSEGKVTLPGLHQVYRTVKNGQAQQDTIGTLGEFHPDAKPLLEKVMEGGRLVKEMPSLAAIRRRVRTQLDQLPAHLFELGEHNDKPYKVLLSDALQELVASEADKQGDQA